MPTGTSHIRNGMGSVRPYLAGPVELMGFITAVFDAEEIERNEGPPGQFHMEYKIAECVVAVEAGDWTGAHEPWTGQIYIYVVDVDAVYAKAVAAGATSIIEPGDKPYQERQAGFKDPGGNTWWVSTFLGD